MPVSFKYLGDKYNANRLRFSALRHLEILKNAMRFQGLQQNRRVVTFADGVSFLCSSVLGFDTIEIYVPPLLPVTKDAVPIIEERYCWCSTYFTEGKIISVLRPDDREGLYPADINRHYYYVNIFNAKHFAIDEYLGVLYSVEVCRGRKKEILTCSSTDLRQYKEGEEVVLFCVGDYLAASTWKERTYPFANALQEPQACGGSSGNCYSCNALTNTGVELEKLEGTYVVTPLTFTGPDNSYSKLVTKKELEKGDVHGGKAYLPYIGDLPLEENQVHVQLFDSSVITADVCAFCQTPHTQDDRKRIAAMSVRKGAYPLLLLKTGESYTVLGFSYSVMTRCPTAILDIKRDLPHERNVESTYILDMDRVVEPNVDFNSSPVQVIGYNIQLMDFYAMYRSTPSEYVLDYFHRDTTATRPGFTAPLTNEDSVSYTAESDYDYVVDGDYIGTVIDYTITESSSSFISLHPTIYCLVAKNLNSSINYDDFTYSNGKPLIFKSISNVLNSFSSYADDGIDSSTHTDGRRDIEDVYLDKDSKPFYTYTKCIISQSDRTATMSPEFSGTYSFFESTEEKNLLVHGGSILFSSVFTDTAYFLYFSVCKDLLESQSGAGSLPILPDAPITVVKTESEPVVYLRFYKQENISDLNTFSLDDCELVDDIELLTKLETMLLNYEPLYWVEEKHRFLKTDLVAKINFLMTNDE